MRAAVALAAAVLAAAVGCSSTVSGTGTPAGLRTSASTPNDPAPSTPNDPAPSATTLVPYRGDRFTVSMPGTPTKETRTAQTAAGPIKVTFIRVRKGRFEYALSYNDYPASVEPEIDGVAPGAATSSGGEVSDLRRTTYQGKPARDFRIIGVTGGSTVHERAILDGHRLYQLLVAMPGADVKTPPAEFAAMLASLEI